MTIELMSKFCPAIRTALMNNHIILDDIDLDFEDIRPAFRAIKRNLNDNSPLQRSDFDSQFEKANPNKKLEYSHDKEKYSCSCFLTREALYWGFPPLRLKPDRNRCAVGTIKKQNGAIIVQPEEKHVHWFLYDSAKPELDFQIEKGN